MAIIYSYNKYRNIKTEVDGILFDSRVEAEYYKYLKLLVKTKEIKSFERQKRIVLQEAYQLKGRKKERPITYVVDFIVHHNDGSIGYVDVKGTKTEVFNMKRKLFEFKYKEPLKIVKRKGGKWEYE